jgi:hypothetical protein
MYFNQLTMDINRNNYETFFLLYLDRELGLADKLAVESFLSENADLQKEFILLQQTISSPEEMVFEPKELLFRKEEKRRIVPIYWIQVAASVVALLMAGWFIRTEVSKNHKVEISGRTQIATANIPSSKDPIKTDAKNKNQADQVDGKLNEENVNQRNQSVAKKSAETNNSDKAIIQYKSLNQNAGKKVSVGTNRDLTENNIPDQQNSRTVPVSDESQIAALKSSTALEIQHDEIPVTNDPKQISSLTKTQASTLVIVSAGSNVQSKNEYANLKETDSQTDNAISVIALNENNKSITGFFKKLTKLSPDENKTTSTRKVHVSVFQFSY